MAPKKFQQKKGGLAKQPPPKWSTFQLSFNKEEESISELIVWINVLERAARQPWVSTGQTAGMASEPTSGVQADLIEL